MSKCRINILCLPVKNIIFFGANLADCSKTFVWIAETHEHGLNEKKDIIFFVQPSVSDRHLQFSYNGFF